MAIAEPQRDTRRRPQVDGTSSIERVTALSDEREAPAPICIGDVFRVSGYRRLPRKVFDYLVRLNGTPEAIAWGLALGLFVAVTPTVGGQMLIAVALAGLLRVNKAAAAVGVWLTNPLTIPFFYGLTYSVGATLLGHPETAPAGERTFQDLLSAAPHVLASCLVGGVLVGTVIALASYPPVLFTIRAARATARAAARRRRQRRLERERRRAGSAEITAEVAARPD